jgi:branched-chain amino acid transport system substrate-binding protein
VLVAATAQTVSLARPENDGLFFRPGSNTLDEAGPLAATVAADGNTTVAVIASTHPYTAGLFGAFEGAFAAESCDGGACEVSYHGTYPVDADPETFDFSPVVEEALASNPDALFISSYPADGKAVFNAVWDAGWRGPLYTSAAAGNENLALFLPAEQASQIKWATLGEAVGPGGEFVRKLWVDSGFRSKDFFGPVPSHYDAMFLLGLAIVHAESMEGRDIATSMREVANAPGEPINAGEWAKATAALEEGRDVDYVGITSDVDFDDLGNNTEIVTVIKGYRNGQPTVL